MHQIIDFLASLKKKIKLKENEPTGTHDIA
jgi:hypothetical protein